jgi:hypothetical protein
MPQMTKVLSCGMCQPRNDVTLSLRVAVAYFEPVEHSHNIFMTSAQTALSILTLRWRTRSLIVGYSARVSQLCSKIE